MEYGIIKIIGKILHMFIPNKSTVQLRVLKEKYDVYNKMLRKYSNRVNIYTSSEKLSETNQTIYSAWFQGEADAPEIVKACWASIKQNLPNYRLVIITNKNYRDYVKIDSRIIEKYECGIIGTAHFSDIIRTKIMIEYGGIWIDATVLCTDRRLVDYLYNNNIDLFVYQNFKSEDISSVLSNWFIYAKKNNVILKSTYDLLIEYWKDNNRLINYFIYHMLFTIVVKKYSFQWEKMPVIPNTASHLMQSELFNRYNASRFDMLCSLCSFHKLTYKFSEEKTKKDNTIYQYILGRYIWK